MDTADRRSGQTSDYLAAERTFLAWIRTGLALMGFGFVVARFGLFLQALQADHSNIQARPFGPSVWLGTGLIVLGIVVNLFSAWSHIRLARHLGQGGSAIHGPSTLAVAVAAVLALLGLAMAIYVVSVNGPHPQPRTDKEESMAPGAESGIVTIPSRHSVDETVANIQKILAAKGVKLFALVDHSGEAEKAGLRMPNTKLLIFGNPKVGTPMMLGAPSIAIDLPLKILVAEGADGRVSISYNAPGFIQARHHLPEELARAYAGAGVDVVAAKAAE